MTRAAHGHMTRGKPEVSSARTESRLAVHHRRVEALPRLEAARRPASGEVSIRSSANPKAKEEIRQTACWEIRFRSFNWRNMVVSYVFLAQKQSSPSVLRHCSERCPTNSWPANIQQNRNRLQPPNQNPKSISIAHLNRNKRDGLRDGLPDGMLMDLEGLAQKPLRTLSQAASGLFGSRLLHLKPRQCRTPWNATQRCQQQTRCPEQSRSQLRFCVRGPASFSSSQGSLKPETCLLFVSQVRNRSLKKATYGINISC